MNIFGLGTAEILLIFFVFLLFFGKDRLPGLARSLGKSLKEFQMMFRGIDEPSEKDAADTSVKSKPPTGEK